MPGGQERQHIDEADGVRNGQRQTEPDAWQAVGGQVRGGPVSRAFTSCHANLNKDGDRGCSSLLPAAVAAVTVTDRLLQLPQQLIDDTTQSGPTCTATLQNDDTRACAWLGIVFDITCWAAAARRGARRQYVGR